MRLSRHRETCSIVGDRIDTIGSKHVHLCPEDYRNQRIARDGTINFHLTIMSAEECKTLQSDQLKELYDSTQSCLGNLYELGVAQVKKSETEDCFYVVIHCPRGDEIRRQFNLPSKVFHITLGFRSKDLHGAVNLHRSIFKWNDDTKDLLYALKHLLEIKELEWNTRNLEYLSILTYRLLDSFSQVSERSVLIVAQLREVGKWCFKFGDLVLCKDIGESLLINGFLFGAKLLILCGLKEREDYNVLDLKHLFPINVEKCLSKGITIDKMVLGINKFLLNTTKDMNHKKTIMMFNKKEKKVELVKLPRNFSWVSINPEVKDSDYNNLLCGTAKPSSESDFIALSSIGVKTVLTVMEEPLEKTLSPSTFEFITQTLGMNCVFFPVVDRTPPTKDQLRRMCDVINEVLYGDELISKRGVLVHCAGGVGRTNTVLASYMVLARRISSAEAIRELTEQRKLILSQSQIMALKEWNKLVYRDKVGFSSFYKDFNNDTALEVSLKEFSFEVCKPSDHVSMRADGKGLPKIILLCGFAGSGKSTFSRAIVEYYGSMVVRVNKDEMRGKNECETVLFDALRAQNSGKEAKCIIIDCCNLTREIRKRWVESCHFPSDLCCVYFALDADKCKERVKSRSGHPTIPPGERGTRIVGSMQKMLEPPELTKEKYLRRVVTLRDEGEVIRLLNDWGVKLVDSKEEKGSLKALSVESKPNKIEHTLMKFPRTMHLVNLGAATRDDKVLSEHDLKIFFGAAEVVVEEKMDGANMGISLNPQSLEGGSEFLVQNRSHYVSSNYHPQFAPLDAWLKKHGDGLRRVLDYPDNSGNRFILYGEWLYATHSVFYNSLPGWFMAYDLWDSADGGRFLGRSELERRLEGSGIPIVPVVFQGKLQSLDQLLSLVSRDSEFIECYKKTGKEKEIRTAREGVVVRINENGVLKHRGKIVRSDFIAGNERWNRSSVLQKNSINPLKAC